MVPGKIRLKLVRVPAVDLSAKLHIALPPKPLAAATWQANGPNLSAPRPPPPPLLSSPLPSQAGPAGSHHVSAHIGQQPPPPMQGRLGKGGLANRDPLGHAGHGTYRPRRRPGGGPEPPPPPPPPKEAADPQDVASHVAPLLPPQVDPSDSQTVKGTSRRRRRRGRLCRVGLPITVDRPRWTPQRTLRRHTGMPLPRSVQVPGHRGPPGHDCGRYCLTRSHCVPVSQVWFVGCNSARWARGRRPCCGPGT